MCIILSHPLFIDIQGMKKMSQSKVKTYIFHSRFQQDNIFISHLKSLKIARPKLKIYTH